MLDTFRYGALGFPSSLGSMLVSGVYIPPVTSLHFGSRFQGWKPYTSNFKTPISGLWNQAFETDSTQPWPRHRWVWNGWSWIGLLGVKNSPSARNLVKNAGCKIIQDLKMLTMFRRKTKKGGGFEWPQEVKTNVISSINCLNLEDPCLK